MNIKIIADSSCDMFTMPGFDYASAPLTVGTDERSYIDDENLDLNDMLEYLAGYKGRSFTACPSISTWLDCFEGADVIYVVTMSSNISGTYNSAMQAAEAYKETNPDAKIHVFDSLSAGPEVRLLIEKIGELVKAGKDFDEVCRIGEDYLKHSRVFFALESFHNFAENGRINKTVALLAGKLGIRILATATTNGTIDVVDKCRGEKKTKSCFIDCIKNAGFAGGKLKIAHCNNIEFAEALKADILAQYPTSQIEIYPTGGLCSFYAENGGILLSCECDREYV